MRISIVVPFRLVKSFYRFLFQSTFWSSRCVVIILLLSLGCQKDEAPLLPTISTISVETIGDNLFFTAKVSAPNPSDIQYMGFAISDQEGALSSAGDVRHSGAIESGYIRLSRPIFEDARLHYCRPFLKTKTEFIFGEEVTFYGGLYHLPEIRDFEPKSGTEGEFVKIYGANFGLRANEVRVYFGNKEADVESFSSERIVVKVPDYKFVEQLPIKVQRYNDVVEADDFFDLKGPHITSIDPSEGYEWITIKIAGNQFSDVTWRNSVMIGLYSMEVTAASHNEITARINSRKLLPGEYQISVAVDDRIGVANELFEVQTPWQVLTPKPGGGFCHSTQFVIDSKVYICTGTPIRWNGYPATTQLWEYDMINDKWTQKADFPGEARMEAVGFSINGKGYLATGYVPNVTETKSDLWEYNPSTDQWTQKASIPDGGRNGASAFTYQNKGYVLLGGPKYVSLPDRKDFWEYDPVADQWTQLSDFPGKGRYGAKVVMRGDNLYVAGGFSYREQFPPDLWKYNITSKTWSSLGEIRFSPQAMYTYQNNVYVISFESDYFDIPRLAHFQLDPDANKRVKECYVFPALVRTSTTFNAVFNDAFYLGMGIDEVGYNASYDCMGDIWKLELKHN